ncbi:hypothetical protein [uncultured Dokdonia sp.]|uniref:hypothetical protein n=1 Tax=uncultured Dokdonia sp. TaxID=575653 RepID=UPI00261F7431|nr:hypothetical protein [uncultured Dokdonia sp.]
MKNKITSTSKKKEVLFVDPYLTGQRTQTAEEVLQLLNQYKTTYLQEIKEGATMDEVIKAISTNRAKEILLTKYAKDTIKLQESFTHLNEADALEMLSKTSTAIVEKLVNISTNVIQKLQGTGIQIEHFALNEDFVMNSKVDGRIKNMSAIYCANAKQKDLRNLAIKISELIQGAMQTGLLHHNRLGTIAENIIDINTGKIKHQYIMRQV